jgi:hypothetical protein
MKNRGNIMMGNKKAFWDGFLFVFGFRVNPFLKYAREIKRKTVNDRVSDSFEHTSSLFCEVYAKEASFINEQ